MAVIYSKKLDFGGTATPVAASYTRFGAAAYTATRGFGWVGTGLTLLNTGFTADPLTQDCVRGNDAELHLDVPNGTYTVKLTRVDPRQRPDRVTITVGSVAGPPAVVEQTVWHETITDHKVTDGKLKIKFVSDGLTASYFGLAAVEVEGVDVPVPPPPPDDLPDLPGLVTGWATAAAYLTHPRARTPYLQGALFVRFATTAQAVLGEAVPPPTVNTPGAYALELDASGVVGKAGLALVGGTIINNMVRADAAVMDGTPHTLCVSWDATWMWLLLDGVLVAEGNKGRDPEPSQITEDDYFQGVAPTDLLLTNLRSVSHALLADATWTVANVATAHEWAGGVAPPPPPPTELSVDAGPSISSTEHLVTFAPLVAGGTLPYTYAWDYGDGMTGANSFHRYDANGTYTVSLMVTDATGATATDTIGVTVEHTHTPDTPPPPSGRFYFTRHGDRLVDYCHGSTFTTTKAGDALDPTVWSTGRVPGPTDRVVPNHALTLGGKLTVHSWRTGPAGKLTLNAGAELWCFTFQDHETSELTCSSPAQVVIRNGPIDTVYDPEQWGHGLNILGKFTVSGSVRAPFVEVIGDVPAGATTLSLADAATGWRAGDQLVLPDTRQLNYENGGHLGIGYEWQGETVTVQSVSADGRTVTLTAPLQFAHAGFRARRNPILDYLVAQSRVRVVGYSSPDLEERPVRRSFHVQNLTRDCVIRSENPAGVRGIAAFLDMAAVDVSGAQFQELGRTTNAAIDNTTFDEAGNVTHVGTNQMGRYPVHFHHCHNRPRFAGNAVWSDSPSHTFKWAVVLHGTSDAVVSDNAVYNWAGSGISTEDGTERRNVIRHNMVCRIRGPYGSTFGGLTGGDTAGCFWLIHSDNIVEDNVASGCIDQDGTGFYWFQKQLGALADPVLNFRGNQTYGAISHGISIWNLGVAADTALPLPGQPQSVFKDFFCANYTGTAFFPYNVANLLFDGFTAWGDVAVSGNACSNGAYNGGGDYYSKDVTFRNVDTQGLLAGFTPGPKSPDGTLTVEDAWFSDQIAGAVGVATLGASTIVDGLGPRKTVLRNCRYGPNVPEKLGMYWYTDANNLRALDAVYLYRHNGDPAKNFRAYYREQAPDVVMASDVFYAAAGGYTTLGSPEPGLTNAQLKAKYGIEPAGKVAPTTALDGISEGVNGLIEPIPAEVVT